MPPMPSTSSTRYFPARICPASGVLVALLLIVVPFTARCSTFACSPQLHIFIAMLHVLENIAQSWHWLPPLPQAGVCVPGWHGPPPCGQHPLGHVAGLHWAPAPPSF